MESEQRAEVEEAADTGSTHESTVIDQPQYAGNSKSVDIDRPDDEMNKGFDLADLAERVTNVSIHESDEPDMSDPQAKVSNHLSNALPKEKIADNE